MSDLVIKSQERNSRYFQTTDDKKMDILKPAGLVSLVSPVSYDLTSIQPIGSSSGFAKELVFMIPPSLGSYLSEIFLASNITTSSVGGFSDFCALNLISRVQVRHGSNVIHDYQYAPVMNWCLEQIYTEKAASILQASGGASFLTPAQNAEVVSPIPTFFSNLFREDTAYSPFLNLNLLSAPLEVRLTIRPLNEIIAAGGNLDGTFNSCKLYLVHADTSDVLRQSHMQDANKYSYFSMDWQTVAPTTGVAAFALNQRYDLSAVYGAIEQYWFKLHPDAELSTAQNLRYRGSGIALASALFLDGRPYLQTNSASDAVDMILNTIMGHYQHPSFPTIKYGFGKQCALIAHDLQYNSGYISTDSFNKVELVYNNTAGVNTIYCVAVAQCLYEIRNGVLIRSN